ncbi:hypothetical protein OIU79_002344 [Salix purpurea]|uniref:Microsomal glutathione S-transferase 3 n=1 Tax=Salix purpurea TaxID=77065 RepID=A0A9Q0ZI25_SALPP|nr:hypothetical protein OIU79_002344 [Salix purpurea]
MAGLEMFPARYGNVAFVLVAYCFLNFWMAFMVGKARKKYNVPYPTLYAVESENKEAKLFNCVQRASEFPGTDASVLYADDVRRDKASLSFCCSWIHLYCHSVFLFHWLFHWGSSKTSHYWEIWVLGFDWAYGVHNFIRHQSSSRDQCLLHLLLLIHQGEVRSRRSDPELQRSI